MWVQLSTWRVQDGQFPELAVGDTWDTRLEVVLDGAEQVPDALPLGIRLVGKPLTPAGPLYEIVGRVCEDDVVGLYLDAAEIVVAPTSYSTWPRDTVLRLQAELLGSENLFSEPPDPLIRSWRVRRLVIRYARAVPAGEQESWRSDSTDVRFREVDRMRMWGTPPGPDLGRRAHSMMARGCRTTCWRSIPSPESKEARNDRNSGDSDGLHSVRSP